MRKSKVRTYVVENPMDRMPDGEYSPMCCVHGSSGAVVTVVVKDGVQTWTYDYSGVLF